MVRNRYISFLQVAYVCDVIANDPQLAGGYNGLGISQVKEIIDQNIRTILTSSEPHFQSFGSPGQKFSSLINQKVNQGKSREV